jgi:multiple sugar transport system substrate-binding protein/putative aldouronate transport system substrate-binding protein
MMIGSKTKDPQRMVDFVDWLYSPEGISMATTGPEGLTREMKDGQPYLTDFGQKFYIGKDKELKVPEEWGGGSISNGNPQLNFKPVGQSEINPETGTYYSRDRWDSVISLTTTTISKDWSDTHEGYVTPIKYFKDKNFLSVIPGVPFAVDQYTTDVKTIKEQCKQIILQDSWQMCFAKDENEFNALLKDMQDTCIGLGYEQVFEADKKNCEKLFEEAKKYITTNQ